MKGIKLLPVAIVLTTLVVLLQVGAALLAQSGTGSSIPTRFIGGYAHRNITTNTTTTVKSSPGTLGCITINTAGATANTATVYDNTAGSGTTIATINTTAGVATLCYHVQFTTGLTIVTATGTAANLTVGYR